MKSIRILFGINVLMLALIMTSCDSEELTGAIQPDMHSQLATGSDQYIENLLVSSGEMFEFSSPMYLSIGKVAPGIDGGNKDLISIRGAADSYMFKWGSWIVSLDLVYNTESNEVSGTYQFIFPDLEEKVTFQVEGANSLAQAGERYGRPVYELSLNAEIIEGSGRFANLGMSDGNVVISDAMEILKVGTRNIAAVCGVEGTLYEIQ